MRADFDALVALDAKRRLPHRNLGGDVAFLPAGGAGRPGAVRREGADRERIAAAGQHDARDVADEVGCAVGHGRWTVQHGRGPGRNRHFVEGRERAVDGRLVPFHHLFALFAVALLDRLLDAFEGLGQRQHAAEGEEADLHDGVDASAEAGSAGDGTGVNRVEPQLLRDDLLLRFRGEAVPERRDIAGGVKQKHPAGRDLIEHRLHLEQEELMAGDEPGLVHEVGGADGLVAEAEMGNGDGARLFRVVDEVTLRVLPGLLGDDFDGVLVGPHRAVGAQAEENGVGAVGRFEIHRRIVAERESGDVVEDADGKRIFRGGLAQLGIDSQDHRGGEFLGGQSIAATDDGGTAAPRGEPAGQFGLAQSGDDIDVERFAHGAGFLGAVQHSDGTNGGRQRLGERLDGEGAIEPDLQDADLFAVGVEPGGRFGDGFGPGAHDHHHAFGLGVPLIIVQVVGASGLRRELVHHLLGDGGHGVVEAVDGFPGLEEHIGILGRTAQDGPIRGETAAPEGGEGVDIDQRAQRFVVDLDHRVDLVGGPEPVEEMQDGNAGEKGGGVRDRGEVMRLLGRVGGQHGPAALAAGHDIGVIAEDRQRMRGQRPGGDMDDAGGELTRDLVHVGDHQQEALRGRERAGEHAALHRAVHRAGGTALGLHLDHLGHLTPDVRQARDGPFVGELGHRRRRRDRIDGEDIADAIGDRGDSFVSINAQAGGHGGIFHSVNRTK